MESAKRLSVHGGMPIPVIVGIAAAATIASLFIRWGEGGTYSLGPTLPWAYFIASTFVGWILSSPRVLPSRDDVEWRSRMFATAYLAIGVAAVVSLTLNIVFFFPNGVQRSIHTMLMNERVLFTLVGALIYLVPLAVALPASLMLVVRDAYKSLTVGVFALIVFTVALAVTELSAEYLLLFSNLR